MRNFLDTLINVSSLQVEAFKLCESNWKTFPIIVDPEHDNMALE